MTGRWRRRSAVVVALAAALLVTGCSSGSTTSRDSVAPAGGSPEMAAPNDGAGVSDTGGAADESSAGTSSRPGAGATGQGSDTPGAAAVALVPRELVITGTLTVRVKDVTAAAARARALATQLGGVVSAERIIGAGADDRDSTATSRATEGSPSAQLTLRIPTDRADEAMDRLAELGTLAERDLSTEDVTAQVVDVESRVATARASVERVRALLDQAKTLGEVVQIESELTRRQADLESLEAQRKRLADLTELATVTATFVPRSAQIVAPTDDGGFLAGLRAGWSAFVAAARTGLTVLGAVLPFLALVALLAVPVLLLRRRSRRASTEPGEDGSPA